MHYGLFNAKCMGERCSSKRRHAYAHVYIIKYSFIAHLFCCCCSCCCCYYYYFSCIFSCTHAPKFTVARLLLLLHRRRTKCHTKLLPSNLPIESFLFRIFLFCHGFSVGMALPISKLSHDKHSKNKMHPTFFVSTIPLCLIAWAYTSHTLNKCNYSTLNKVASDLIVFSADLIKCMRHFTAFNLL